MQLAGLETEQPENDGESVALLLCFEEDDNSFLVEVGEDGQECSLAILGSVLFDLYDLLMQLLGSLIIGISAQPDGLLGGKQR